MPLIDHFQPPVSERRHWESFHGAWAHEMMGALNGGLLPPGYFAEAQVHIGSRVEVDVASLQESASGGWANGNGGVAVQTWAPPKIAHSMAALFPDDIRVEVFSTAAGATLVAAVELVSPGNKDRPEARRLFAGKCATYLQAGLGLVVVDVVTERLANLHNELVETMAQASAYQFPADQRLYAVAYHPFRHESGDRIEFWPEPLAVGQALPTVALALRGGPTIPLDLEVTYTEARLRSRL